MSPRILLVLTGFVGAFGVGIGAFGAHSLQSILQDLPPEEFLKREAWLKTGAAYHMYHAVALLAVALASLRGVPGLGGVGIAWLIGIAVFSGGLYAMSLTGITKLGMVVPIGGVAFLVGWVLVIVAGWKMGPTA